MKEVVERANEGVARVQDDDVDASKLWCRGNYTITREVFGKCSRKLNTKWFSHKQKGYVCTDEEFVWCGDYHQEKYKERLKDASVLFVGDSLTYQQADEMKCLAPWLNQSFIFKRHFFEFKRQARHQHQQRENVGRLHEELQANFFVYTEEPDFFPIARDYD